MEIDVQAQSSPDLHLDVTLKNTTAAAVTIYEHALPWVGSNSMLLIAVKTDAVGTVLEKRSPVDDPGPATITIQPGETLTGTIQLVSRFPGFLDALEERDVIVFWSFQIQPKDLPALTRLAGHAFFSKRAKE